MLILNMLIFCLRHCVWVSCSVVLALCNPIDCSPWNSPGKNAGVGCHSFSRASSPSRGQIWVSCIAGRLFTTELPKKPLRHIECNQNNFYLLITLSVFGAFCRLVNLSIRPNSWILVWLEIVNGLSAFVTVFVVAG